MVRAICRIGLGNRGSSQISSSVQLSLRAQYHCQRDLGSQPVYIAGRARALNRWKDGVENRAGAGLISAVLLYLTKPSAGPVRVILMGLGRRHTVIERALAYPFGVLQVTSRKIEGADQHHLLCIFKARRSARELAGLYIFENETKQAGEASHLLSIR